MWHMLWQSQLTLTSLYSKVTKMIDRVKWELKYGVNLSLFIIYIRLYIILTILLLKTIHNNIKIKYFKLHWIINRYEINMKC